MSDFKLFKLVRHGLSALEKAGISKVPHLAYIQVQDKRNQTRLINFRGRLHHCSISRTPCIWTLNFATVFCLTEFNKPSTSVISCHILDKC
jgi:hypothetical protein